MSHLTTDEETAGRAALYALGTLEGEEARAFEEHVAAGCSTCAAELRDFEAVVAVLGLAASEAEPPVGVRSRLLELVAKEGNGGARAFSSSARARASGCRPTTRASPTSSSSQTRGAAPSRRSSEWSRARAYARTGTSASSSVSSSKATSARVPSG